MSNLIENLIRAADSGDSDRDTSRMMREAAAEIARLQPPKRDREADRARFTDKDFNRWLDDGISDAGHTVSDAVGCTASAWAGWEARQTLDMGQPAGFITPQEMTALRALIDTEYMDARARRRLNEWADKVETSPAWRAHPQIPTGTDMANALSWVRDATEGDAGCHLYLWAIEEAIAAYDVERVARAGHTVHRNAGDSEANFIADGDRLNCPACGGSGHVDDASQRITQGDVVAIACELAKIDGLDPEDEQGGAYHVVWSGQPPEPMGDPWNLEYLPKAGRIAKALGYVERPTVNAEPAAPADDLAKVVAFLLGEAAMHGVWFGEKHPSGQPYWWRNNLRAAARRAKP